MRGFCSRVQPNTLQRARLWLARKHNIRRDPLPLRDATSGLLLAHQDLTHESRASAPFIHCPTLLMLAGRERIIDNAATKGRAHQLRTRELTLQEYPDAQHTLKFEPHSDQFVNDLLAWLQGERMVGSA